MSAIIQRYFSRFTIVSLSLILLGIAIYLLDPGQTGTAQSNPNAGPTLLQSADIGHVGQPGAYVTLDGEHAIRSFGSDIWDTKDGFHYAYQVWNGDGEFIALVHEMTDSHPRARAGIMVRASLDADAANAFVTATPNHGIHFLRRRETAGLTWDDAHTNLGMTSLEDRTLYQRRFSDLHPQDKSTVNQVNLPRWFRIVRSGDTFHVYDSADGEQWEWIGTDTIPMPEDVYVGLAVSSRNPEVECVATFSRLSFSAHSVQTLANQMLVEPVIGNGDGLRGRYFGDRNFEDEVLNRVDPQLEFIWWQEGPAEGMPTDQFSVRWEGLLEAQYTEPYLLHLVADEQASMWLDGRLLIDDWFEHRATETAALVNLEAGKQYHIRVDYSEASSHAMVRLEWSSPSTARETIPQRQLYSHLADTDNDQLPDAWERAFSIEPGQAVPDALRQSMESAESSFATLRGETARSVASLLEASYSSGKHPGARAGRTKPVDQAPGWVSLDLSAGGPDGRAQGLREVARQRLTATSARYGQVDGRFPAVTRDKFHFSYQLKQGDYQLIARIADIESRPPRTLAGVMVRATTEPTSPFVAVMVSPTRESWVLCREQSGHGARMQRLGVQAQWVKLERRGPQVRLYESTDGETWRWLGHEPFVLSAEACFGIAAQGAGMASQATVELDRVSLRPLASAGRDVPALVGTGTGLTATYRDATQNITQVEGPIDFYWPDGTSPVDGLADDHFSVNWEGELEAQYDEIYTLELACDDGARLWLDGLLFIDDWRDSSAYPRSIKIELQAGRRYPIRLEYYEASRDASASLHWSSPSTVRQVIPRSQLYSTRGNASFSFVGRGQGALRPHPESNAASSGTSEWVGPPTPDEGGTTLQLVRQLDVTGFQNPLGEWEIDERGLRCRSLRGSVEYEFSVSQAGMYLLDLIGEAALSHPDPNYFLWIDVDGQHLSRRLLSGDERKGAQQLTPWLRAGTHRLKLFWDNSLPHRSLRLTEIKVQILTGPDDNANQIADWMEAELARANTIDSAATSLVSPATVEGRTIYWGLAAAQTGDQNEVIPVEPGAGERWSLSLPLDPDAPAQVDLAFENDGLQTTHQVTWTPTDLTQATHLVVRQGDALLLALGSNETSREGDIDIGGQVHHLSAGSTLPYTFSEPGTVFIEASWFGGRAMGLIRVTVIAPTSIANVAALSGQWREWTPGVLPNEIALEVDPALELGRLASNDGEARYRLRTNDPLTRYLNLRLGEGGPILQRVAVDGFRLDYGNRTGPAWVAQTFPDRSRLVGSNLILTPIRSQIRLQGRILAGGILYASGQIQEDYGPSVFDVLGMATQTFFLTSASKTSVCHQIDVFQGADQINEF